MKEQNGPDFDSIKQINVYGIEYWSARALMPLLGYANKWQNFEHVIKKAITAATSPELGMRPEDHFSEIHEETAKGKGAKQSRKNYLLSRRACYLIAQNGDPEKPQIKLAQNYFSFTAEVYDMNRLLIEQEKRLSTRLKVSESYKALDEAASVSGVDSEFFGIFIDAGYLGLHRHTVEELKQLKGVSESEDYLDNISREELSAIDFKNTQTEGKLLAEHVQGNEEAAKTHYFVGDQVRKAIEAIHRPFPEDLPSAPSIRKMVEERRRKAAKKKLKAAEQDQRQIGQVSLFDDGQL